MSGVRLLDHWSPPEGAGHAVACLATSFTFDSDFFTDQCLARFLGLSCTSSEGDKISSIAAVLEEEERLSEARVTVLVDRSSSAAKRNLRWDVLTVPVRGGLLHAKVAALVWERAARVVIGSANLTEAGYRRQVELAVALDFVPGSRIPRPLANALVDELRRLVELVPGEGTGPKQRASATLDLLAGRMGSLDLPATGGRDLRVAVAPARPGTSPLDRLDQVWDGAKPLRATALSPFWDDVADPPALTAIHGHLTGRPASDRRLSLIVAADPYSAVPQAPAALFDHADSVARFVPAGTEPRRLHAKLLMFESDAWTAAMIGSSNITEAGLGLHPRHGHHELNLWIGCPKKSETATHIRSLIKGVAHVDGPANVEDPECDEDEPTVPSLPIGFGSCVIEPGEVHRVRLTFAPDELPTSWRVMTPDGQSLLDHDEWTVDGTPTTMTIELPGRDLVAYLVVSWDDDSGDGELRATWTANVSDPSVLPAPPALADVPVGVLLAALASTRPLPVALEAELRKQEHQRALGGEIDLDPLKAFDDSGLLIRRVRNLSVALWRLHDRLGRPATSLDAVKWRLHGAIGPIALADGIVAATLDNQWMPTEAHFMLGELALTVGSVDWNVVAHNLDAADVAACVADVIAQLDERCRRLPSHDDPAIEQYVTAAFAEAGR
jgi:hypothetical protein